MEMSDVTKIKKGRPTWEKQQAHKAPPLDLGKLVAKYGK